MFGNIKINIKFILVIVSSILFIFLFINNIYLIIKVDKLDKEVKNINTKLIKLEENISWVTHHLFLSE